MTVSHPFFERHRAMLDRAVEAIASRGYWTPFPESPSPKVYGEGAAYVVNTGEGYRFYGTGLRDFDIEDRVALDEFDRWGSERDRRLDASVSLRYVSADVIGYALALRRTPGPAPCSPTSSASSTPIRRWCRHRRPR